MRLTIGAFRRSLADIINRVSYRGERIVLERRGKPVAVLIPVEEYEFLESVIAQREDAADLKAARAAKREKGKPVPLEQVKRELGITSPSRTHHRRKTA